MPIDLKEALSIIKSGDWIKSIRCITANLGNNTGGQVLELKHCRIARRQTMEQHGTDTTGITDIKKDARHNFHFTLNLEMKNKQIRKIHPILIYEIDKQRVI